MLKPFCSIVLTPPSRSRRNDCLLTAGSGPRASGGYRGQRAWRGFQTTSGLLRRQAASAVWRRDGRARSFGHEFESIALIIGGAGPGARRSSSSVAIVLPFQGNAETFLEFAGLELLHRFRLFLLHHLFHFGFVHPLRADRRGGKRADGGSKSASDEQ